MVLRDWLHTTPAGHAARQVLDTGEYYINAADAVPNKPDFILLAGDTGAAGATEFTQTVT